jgi:7-dehydrocholesterol reductase
MYLVSNPINLGPYLASLIFAAGLISVYVNYAADRQKQLVRETNGDCLIWGEKPKVIRANCQLLNGAHSTSLLLVSGYWSITRHFHYIPEILLSFFWCSTALFSGSVAYFYVFYLIILLSHRAVRDDNKCRKKYGKYWEEYCKQVPYKIIPYIF